MKSLQRIAATSLLILATAPTLRAEFLVLKIRETTAEHIWQWIAVFAGLLIIFTLKNSRSKGGQGR